MTNALKQSALSMIEDFLGSLGLDRRYGQSRRAVPGVWSLIAGAAAGGAAAAWLMSDPGQDFMRRVRARVQKMVSEPQTQGTATQGTATNGAALTQESRSSEPTKGNANRGRARVDA